MAESPLIISFNPTKRIISFAKSKTQVRKVVHYIFYTNSRNN